MKPTFALPSRLALTAGLLAASALLVSGPAARAELTFQFNFNDTAGMGFNDPILGADRRNAVIDAGIRTGSFFANTNLTPITFDVVSTTEPTSSTLAAAGSGIASTGPGFYRTIVQQKAIGGTDLNGAAADGFATVNFGQNYQLNPNAPVAANQYDFTSTFIHEITHALGFVSLFSTSGPASGNVYSIFDQFLSGSNGVPLVNPNTFQFDTSRVGTLTGGNNMLMATASPTGEFFNGPNANMTLGGALVPIFSPNPYQDGSSGSHLDDNTQITNGLMMTAATPTGPSARTYGVIERGILTDLGYTVVPEPSTYALLALGLVTLGGYVGRRRQRMA